jgi:hypothetical protein
VVGRAHTGIYTVLNESFSHRKLIVLEIHKVFLRPLGSPVRKNLSLKTAKHSQVRDFSARQNKKPRQG